MYPASLFNKWCFCLSTTSVVLSQLSSRIKLFMTPCFRTWCLLIISPQRSLRPFHRVIMRWETGNTTCACCVDVNGSLDSEKLHNQIPLATISNSDRLLRPMTFLSFNVFANENNELSYSGVLHIQKLSTSCHAYYNIIHMSKLTYSFRSLTSERSQMLWPPVNAVFLMHMGGPGTGRTDP